MILSIAIAVSDWTTVFLRQSWRDAWRVCRLATILSEARQAYEQVEQAIHDFRQRCAVQPHAVSSDDWQIVALYCIVIVLYWAGVTLWRAPSVIWWVGSHLCRDAIVYGRRWRDRYEEYRDRLAIG